jgi:DNA repair protein RadB
MDALLGGGIETGALTEVYGEAGTGKTNLCLQLVRQVACGGGRALYVDSEGVSSERLAQIAGEAQPLVEQRLHLERVTTVSGQARAAERAVRIAEGIADVQLVIVDSATLLYRVQLAEGDGRAERRALLRQLHGLQAAARTRGFALVVTNQVFSLPNEDVVQGLGGHGMRHLAGCVVRLERGDGPGARSAVLVKHRSRPEGLVASFALGNHGLEPSEPRGPSLSTETPKHLSRVQAARRP